MVAILRDTSWSMNGVWSNWAASLCLRVIEVAKKKRMKIGYVEFNHNIDKHVGSDGELFVSDYDAVSDRACSLDCQGITNYQLPLQVRAYTHKQISQSHASFSLTPLPSHLAQVTLNAFQDMAPGRRRRKHGRSPSSSSAAAAGGVGGLGGLGGGGGSDFSGQGQLDSRSLDRAASAIASRMARGGGRGGGEGAAGAADKHILFLTDGLPTTGDRMLKAELEQAKQLGVCIHSVFIGAQLSSFLLSFLLSSLSTVYSIPPPSF